MTTAALMLCDAQPLTLIDALEASDLPFRVDVVPFATLPPGCATARWRKRSRCEAAQQTSTFDV